MCTSKLSLEVSVLNKISEISILQVYWNLNELKIKVRQCVRRFNKLTLSEDPPTLWSPTDWWESKQGKHRPRCKSELSSSWSFPRSPIQAKSSCPSLPIRPKLSGCSIPGSSWRRKSEGKLQKELFHSLPFRGRFPMLFE